MVLME